MRGGLLTDDSNAAAGGCFIPACDRARRVGAREGCPHHRRFPDLHAGLPRPRRRRWRGRGGEARPGRDWSWSGGSGKLLERGGRIGGRRRSSEGTRQRHRPGQHDGAVGGAGAAGCHAAAGCRGDGKPYEPAHPAGMARAPVAASLFHAIRVRTKHGENLTKPLQCGIGPSIVEN